MAGAGSAFDCAGFRRVGSLVARVAKSADGSLERRARQFKFPACGILCAHSGFHGNEDAATCCRVETSSPAGTADTMRPTAAAKTEMATAPGEISSSNSGYFSVHVKVRKDSWISLSSDGKVVLQGTILAPATKAVKAHNQIVVKAGNVGALDFEFNGESLPAQGQNGEVKTLTFGAEGLEAVQTVPAGPASGTPAATPTQP
jgi:Domain of unknown function (DUF4115)